MKLVTIFGIVFTLFPVGAFASTAWNASLGTAASFAVLAGSTITNTGFTNVFGDIGLWPGTAITGWPPGIDIGTVHNSDAVALQAQVDLVTAFTGAAADPCTANLTGQDLGGLTLLAGTYCFDSSAQLTGTLTLNSQGDPNARFLFVMGSTLTTASASSVVFVNGGSGLNVYWDVGSSATLGTTTNFQGSLMAFASITLNTGANIGCGRALAITGAVTMDTNQINPGACLAETGVPEPSSLSFLLLGAPGLLLLRRRKVSRT